MASLTLFFWHTSEFDHCLRKKCPYLELFWSIFSRVWTDYWEVRSISPYSVEMWRDTDQNNSKYGHFLLSVTYLSSHFILETSFEKFVKAPQRIYLTQTCIDKNKFCLLFQGEISVGNDECIWESCDSCKWVIWIFLVVKFC